MFLFTFFALSLAISLIQSRGLQINMCINKYKKYKYILQIVTMNEWNVRPFLIMKKLIITVAPKFVILMCLRLLILTVTCCYLSYSSPSQVDPSIYPGLHASSGL